MAERPAPSDPVLVSSLASALNAADTGSTATPASRSTPSPTPPGAGYASSCSRPAPGGRDPASDAPQPRGYIWSMSATSVASSSRPGRTGTAR